MSPADRLKFGHPVAIADGPARSLVTDRETGAELGHVWKDDAGTWWAQRGDQPPATAATRGPGTRREAGLNLFTAWRNDVDAAVEAELAARADFAAAMADSRAADELESLEVVEISTAAGPAAEGDPVEVEHRPTIAERIASIQADHGRALEALASGTSGFVAAWLDGRKPGTARAYRIALDGLANHMAAEPLEALAILFGSGLGPANGIVAAWRDSMTAAGLAPATINQRLSAIRSATSYAGRLGLIGWTLNVESVESRAYRDTAGPPVSTVAAMVHHLTTQPGPAPARDLAIIRLLHDRGLRAAEVAGLDLEHFDPDRCIVWIIPKGRKEREPVTVTRAACDAVAAWLEYRGRRPGPLFVNFDPVRPGGRLTTRSIGRLVAAAGAAVGSPGIRPHGLRHSSITTGLDLNGGDLRAAARHSRHVDTRTVGIYDDNRADLGGELAELVADHLDAEVARLADRESKFAQPLAFRISKHVEVAAD